MPSIAPPQPVPRAQTALLYCLAVGVLTTIWLFCRNGYGFHQDELQFLDDGRHLQWGFVAYPPLTSFLGRLSIALFGISPFTFRLPAVLVNATSVVLAGLLARELGGRRTAQLLAALAALPLGIAFASVLQYNTPDWLSWSLLAYFTARVLRTGDGRNWLGAGLGLGLGVLSKYSIAFAAMSLVVGLLVLPSQRHHLRSRWFWLGALVTLCVAAPNLLWLATHHLATLQMEHHIHVRDVALGRAKGYFTDQIKYSMLALPLLVAGLVWLVRSPRYRLLAAFWIGPFLLFALAQGRGYYLLPGYTVLFAAGPVAVQQALAHRRRWRSAAYTIAAVALLGNCVAIGGMYLPLYRPLSPAWVWQMRHNDDMPREVGWPEFVQQVAAVRDTLPAGELPRLAIVANNYGDAAALTLYGPQYHLPTPISPVNSFHDRGYGPYLPETFLITGSNLRDEQHFASCTVAAVRHPPYGLVTEAVRYHPDLLLCRHLLVPLPELWAKGQTYG